MGDLKCLKRAYQQVVRVMQLARTHIRSLAISGASCHAAKGAVVLNWGSGSLVGCKVLGASVGCTIKLLIRNLNVQGENGRWRLCRMP